MLKCFGHPEFSSGQYDDKGDTEIFCRSELGSESMKGL